jgi:hypothetical protein
MLGFMEMLGGMLVFGRIAAAHVAADQAQAKVDPCVSHFHALRAFPFIGLLKFDFIEVCALL